MAKLQAIVGPTAVGKSDLAELVAQELSCPVISIDAMQVYRGMDIGTAKTPVAARRVPLEMVDVVEPSEDYSAQRFQQDARVCVEASLITSGFAVLCGGTGLYLDAVIDEMDFPAGETGSSARAHYQAIADVRGSQALWELLEERDHPSAQLIHPNNTRRVIRALEMLDNGSSYAEQSSGLHVHRPHYDCDIWALTMDRECLYRRIDQRVDRMFECGLVAEVESLRARGLSLERTAGQAIGYKEILEACDGSSSLEDAAERIKQRSRHYAKRQLSWFRRDARTRWIDLDTTSLSEACDLIVSTAQSKGS